MLNPLPGVATLIMSEPSAEADIDGATLGVDASATARRNIATAMAK
jgi:hypothetical protein